MYSNNLDDFSDKFKNKCYNEKVWTNWFTDSSNINVRNNPIFSRTIKNGFERYGKIIYNNWNKINLYWEKSNKNNRIKIIISANLQRTFESASIRTEERNLPNKYLENLKRDFLDYDKEEINLGLIDNYSNDTILNKIKEKYPNLDISKLEIFEKTDYSHFTENFFY